MFKRIMLVLVLSLICGVGVYAQGIAMNPQTGNLNILDAGTCAVSSGSNANAFVVQQLPQNAGTSTVTLSGTFSATVTVRLSANGGSTWVTQSTQSSVGTASYNVAGFNYICADVTTYASGTVNTTINSSLASFSSGGGGVGAGAAPAMGYYLTNTCLVANTGQCFYTFANTQQANTCTWTAATPSTVVCLSQIFGGTVSGNGTTVTFTTVSVPSNWAIGNSITSTSSGGSYNITCTINGISGNQVTCLNAATGASTTLGYLTNNTVGPFVSGDVGKQAQGWNTCVADALLGGNAITASGSPVITTFTNSTTVQITAASNAQAAATGCFNWGNPDDTGAAQVEAAYDAVTTYCPKLFLAASQYWLNTWHWNTNPMGCVNTASQYGIAAGGFGNVYFPAGFELEGRGTANTIIHIGTNFPTTACTTTIDTLTYTGCFIPPTLGRWRDLQITGDGNGNANLSGALVFCLVCELNDVSVFNYGNNNIGLPGAVTVGVGAGYQAQFTFLNVSAGGIGIDIPSGQGVVNGFRVYSENSATRALSVDGPPGTSGATLGYSFACKYCGFYNVASANANGQNLVFSNDGTMDLENTQIGPYAATGNTSFGYRCQTTNGCVLYLRNSFIKMTQATLNTGIICSNTCTNYIQNTSIVSGATGNTYIDVAGSKFFDECGNSFSGGVASVSGAVYGSCSITGTALVTGNVVLTSGWGGGAAASAFSGSSLSEQWTTTIGTAPSTTAVTTVTFPVPFLTGSTVTCTATLGTGSSTAIVQPQCSATPTTATITYLGTLVSGTVITRLTASN